MYILSRVIGMHALHICLFSSLNTIHGSSLKSQLLRAHTHARLKPVTFSLNWWHYPFCQTSRFKPEETY